MNDQANAQRVSSDELCFSIRRSATIVFRVYIGVMAATMFVIWVAILASPQFALAKRLAFGAAWVVVLVPLFVWLKRRLLDSTVRARPDGLHIYNGIKRHFVRWDDVAGFERSSRPFLFAVRRVSGGTVTMDGITPETFGRRGPQRDQMRELEAYWHRIVG